MKIAFFEIEAWERETFEPLSRNHEVRFIPEPLTEDNISAHRDVEIVSPFIYSDLGGEVLGQLEALS
ncbi:D-lactate dehydrogenase [Methylocaldum marinum]|uniref:D-lactate dehydrogenase n=1 Tax=Methylocaldum marinum TaxID=1432792 RepID=A0A250KP11_9GAMM|nr:hypothetical protein [Methylocaldum marinum]BBA32701.1 D-lactate dehydrogenase [Methylocaldum marinum]